MSAFRKPLLTMNSPRPGAGLQHFRKEKSQEAKASEVSALTSHIS
ncbi:hypothetical protein [Youngiibacter fragilis]|nr:hypothetical protein [Youngiibacter fragilis]